MAKRSIDASITAQRLKALRHKKKITQKQLAEDLDFHVNTIKQYESGKRVPDTGHLQKLARYFNVNPESITENFKTMEDLDSEFLHWIMDAATFQSSYPPEVESRIIRSTNKAIDIAWSAWDLGYISEDDFHNIIFQVSGLQIRKIFNVRMGKENQNH